MSMNQKINSDMFADLLNVKHQPGTLLQRLKLDMKEHNNLNMHDRQIILINNPFQNEEEEEEEEEESMPLSSPLSLPLPLSMIYQQEQEKEQEQEPLSLPLSLPLPLPLSSPLSLPLSSPLPMIYKEREEQQEPLSLPLSSPLPMIYKEKEQEPLSCKENELIIRAEIHLKQQQELIKQQQELIAQQQEQLNAYKKENIVTNNHLPHKKHKKTVRFQLIPFHKKMSRRKTRRATPLPRRSSSFSPKLLKL